VQPAALDRVEQWFTVAAHSVVRRSGYNRTKVKMFKLENNETCLHSLAQTLSYDSLCYSEGVPLHMARGGALGCGYKPTSLRFNTPRCHCSFLLT
jgi:hypothetical protein